MRDFYKEFLTEIDDISESRSLDTATFTYGFIWGRVADEALEDWKTFFL